MVLLERAGSGKTNLMCNTAKRLIDEGVPGVLLLGSDPLDNRFGLVAEVLAALGGDPAQANRPTLVREALHRLLGERPQCVLVDAINEARDVERMQAALLELFAQLKGLRVRMLVSCRDIYWNFLKDAWTETLPCEVRSLGLYRFDPQTWPKVRRRYFDVFHVRGQLESGCSDRRLAAIGQRADIGEIFDRCQLHQARLSADVNCGVDAH